MRWIKIGCKIIIGIIIVIILYLNVSLYYSPTFDNRSDQVYNQDVYLQLLHINNEINKGADLDMQALYPEGFIFLHAMNVMAWANLIEGIDVRSDIYREGLKEIMASNQAINSEQGKSSFTKELPLEYGAFYTGWQTYLLGRQLQLQDGSSRNTDDVFLFKSNCERIIRVLDQFTTPYLESYHEQAWPADAVMLIAALTLHDRIFIPKYQDQRANWLIKVKKLMDEDVQLIPHKVNSISGKSIEGPRGSSQSLMLIFLSEIDPVFAAESFLLYKEYFLTSRLGLPAVLEYPKGQFGLSDIDSGPVIWGVGGAASVVGAQTMAIFSDFDTFGGLRNSIESFGLGVTLNEAKKYLFGTLPIADAFIAWSNSIETQEMTQFVTINGRRYFQALSLMVGLILMVIIVKLNNWK